MRTTAVLAAVVLATAAATVPAVPASAGPIVHSLSAASVSPGAASPNGFVPANVTVSVGVQANDGITACVDEPSTFGGGVGAEMTLTSGTPRTGVLSRRYVTLHLTSGTATNGTWRGTWKVGSPWSGTWTLTRVLACTTSGYPNDYDVDPITIGPRPTLVVSGLNPPTVTVTRSPARPPYGTVQRVTYTYRKAHGTLLAGRRIAVGEDTSCGFYAWGSRNVRLTSAGSFSVAKGVQLGDACPMLTTSTAGIVRPDVDGAVLLYLRASNRWTYGTVTRAASAAAAHVGTPVTVTGRVQYRPDWALPRAALQRLVGSTWTTIATANVRANHRYTLAFTPTRRIVSTLRVVAVPPAGEIQLLATPSAPFRVRGT